MQPKLLHCLVQHRIFFQLKFIFLNLNLLTTLARFPLNWDAATPLLLNIRRRENLPTWNQRNVKIDVSVLNFLQRVFCSLYVTLEHEWNWGSLEHRKWNWSSLLLLLNIMSTNEHIHFLRYMFYKVGTYQRSVFRTGRTWGLVSYLLVRWQQDDIPVDDVHLMGIGRISKNYLLLLGIASIRAQIGTADAGEWPSWWKSCSQTR